MNFNDFLRSEINRLMSSNILFKLELEKITNNQTDPSNFFLISSYDQGIEANFFKNNSEFDKHIGILKNIRTDDPGKYTKYDLTLVIYEDINGDYTLRISLKNNDQNIFKVFYGESVQQLGTTELERKFFSNLNNILVVNILKIKYKFLTENIIMSVIIVLFRYVIPSVFDNFDKNYEYKSISLDIDSLKRANKELSEILELIFFIDRDVFKYKKFTEDITKVETTQLIKWTNEFSIIKSDQQLVYIHNSK